jgi:hypothetical protein
MHCRQACLSRLEVPGGRPVTASVLFTALAGSATARPATPPTPHDFPCEAVCLVRGQPVRIERFYLGE